LKIKKYAFLLLKGISDSSATDALSALTLQRIQRSVSDSAKSDRMTKRYLDELEEQGLIARGAMEGRAYTWYITAKGTNLLKSM